MSAGEVVKIRVTPTEVLACIDIIQAAGVEVPNMSLAQVVRVALTELVGDALERGVITQRTGFEYLDMVTKYRRGSLVRKVQTGHVAAKASMQRAALDMPQARGHLPEPLVVTEEDRARNAAALKLLGVDVPPQPARAKPADAKQSGGAGNARGRIDARATRASARLAELLFKSENAPDSMQDEDWKELAAARRNARGDAL